MITSNPTPGFFETLELRRIHPSRNALLRTETGPLDKLISSIAEKGLLEPIVVRPVEDGFEVVAGNRRLEACEKLKMRRIPCQIVELDDKEAFEVSLIENIQRESLDPIDEARAFKKYVDDYGYGSISELARKTGKSHTYVSRRIQLLNLPKEVRDELVRHRTTLGTVQELAPLDDDGASEVMQIIRERHLSMREARKVVNKYRQTMQQVEPFPSTWPSRYTDASERRARAICRAIDRAVASLRIDMYRLGELIVDIDDYDWIAKETLIQCRATLNEQMENLARFKKKSTRKMWQHYLLCLR